MAPEDPSDWWSSAHHSNCGSSRQVGPARMHSDVTHHFHTRGFWLRKKQEQTSERDRRSFTSADMQFPLLDFLFFPAIHPIFGFSPPGRQQRAFALLIASDIPTLTYTSDSREREKKTRYLLETLEAGLKKIGSNFFKEHASMYCNTNSPS